MARRTIRQCGVTALFLGAALLAACGGGGGTADPAGAGATPAAAPDDGPPGQALDAHASITIGEPTAEVAGNGNSTGRLQLIWQGSGSFSRVTAWVSPGEGRPFIEVPTVRNDPQLTFHPGTTWQIDFPTAQVRVRGCNAGGDTCTDSNAQPLAEALVQARADLVDPVDPYASTVGGSSRFVMDDGGTTLAALRATDAGMFGEIPENFSPARVDLYQFQGAWAGPTGYPTPDYRTVTLSIALSGDGNTMAIPLLYSYGGYAPPDVPGVVLVYYKELDEVGGSRAWRLGAVITAPASLRVVENLGATLALSDDGRRLAALGDVSVYVFDRQADNQWQFVQQIPGATTRQMAMSGDGSVIAFGAIAGRTPVPGPEGGTGSREHHEVRVHACTGDNWTLQATLRSDDFPYVADTLDDFGNAGLALSDDGRTLAVGAPRLNSTTRPGNVYVFDRTGAAGWVRRARLTNAGEPAADLLGLDLALSGDGRVLAASACGTLARAPGVNRNFAQAAPPVNAEPCNTTTQQPGQSLGAHVFERVGVGPGVAAWRQAALAVPQLPPHPHYSYRMDRSLMVPLLSRDGRTLGLGAYRDADQYDGRPGMTTLRIY